MSSIPRWANRRFARILFRPTGCPAVAGLILAVLLGAEPVKAQSGRAPAAPPAVSAFAFVDVSVVDVRRGRLVSNQTVLVEGDRITRVGAAADVAVPPGFERIAGTGRVLIPGLAEMHGHIPSPRQPAEDIEETLFLYVSNGITTVRGMLGHPGQLALRESAAKGDLVSPNLYLAGPSFNGRSVSSTEQAADMVRSQQAEGWDLLKVHPGPTAAEYDAMARTANEIGIRFGGHVPASITLEHALEMGQETFDHLDGYIRALDGESRPVSEDALRHLVERTKAAGAWVVPTMVLWETLYGVSDRNELVSLPELKYVSARDVRSWTDRFDRTVQDPGHDAAAAAVHIRNRMRILGALHAGGVPILMGTDAPQQFSVPGFSLHRELDRMVEAGMSPHDVLVSGTANVGRYFANADTFGHVEAGHRADLVLLAANPLEDVRHLARNEGVMVSGRWYDRAMLDAGLEAVADRHARRPN